MEELETQFIARAYKQKPPYPNAEYRGAIKSLRGVGHHWIDEEHGDVFVLYGEPMDTESIYRVQYSSLFQL
jgi:hypothetical protein